MYDGFEFQPITKEVAIGVLIVLAVLVGIFCTGYMYGIRTAGKSDGGDVPNNGIRIDDVREQLGTAISNQQQITSGIRQAETTAGSIAGRSEAIAKSAETVSADVRAAGELIDECQQIVGRVRNRGQKGTPAN